MAAIGAFAPFSLRREQVRPRCLGRAYPRVSTHSGLNLIRYIRPKYYVEIYLINFIERSLISTLFIDLTFRIRLILKNWTVILSIRPLSYWPILIAFFVSRLDFRFRLDFFITILVSFAADPLVGSIATQYLQNREEHDRIARLWTKRYAT